MGPPQVTVVAKGSQVGQRYRNCSVAQAVLLTDIFLLSGSLEGRGDSQPFLHREGRDGSNDSIRPCLVFLTVYPYLTFLYSSFIYSFTYSFKSDGWVLFRSWEMAVSKGDKIPALKVHILVGEENNRHMV